MAHWAELDENNVVLRVTVGDNDEPDEGYQWIIDNLGGRWIKTSYNGNIRKRFANAQGGVYNPELDVFINPKPFESWVFNDETADWEAPLKMPDDGKQYYWHETTTEWREKHPESN